MLLLTISLLYLGYLPTQLIYDLQNEVWKSQCHLSAKGHRSTKEKEKQMLHIIGLFLGGLIQAVTISLTVNLQPTESNSGNGYAGRI